MTLSPAEQLAHNTVRIECTLSDNNYSMGTGFFYNIYKDDTSCIPVIVTNKHVVSNANRGTFSLTLRNSNNEPLVGNSKIVVLEEFESRWTPHPDPDVDLCVMPIAPLLRAAESEGVQFFHPALDKTLIPSTQDVDNMIGLEAVIMVGYPNGLWDRVNNLPIFRKGVMATSYKYDWNGRKEFLIDAACFPGSSGSPVLLFDISGYRDRTGNYLGNSRIKLLGILYAGPQHTAQGEIQIVAIPSTHRAISETAIPINLGTIIKSELLLSFEGIFN